MSTKSKIAELQAEIAKLEAIEAKEQEAEVSKLREAAKALGYGLVIIGTKPSKKAKKESKASALAGTAKPERSITIDGKTFTYKTAPTGELKALLVKRGEYISGGKNVPLSQKKAAKAK